MRSRSALLIWPSQRYWSVASRTISVTSATAITNMGTRNVRTFIRVSGGCMSASLARENSLKDGARREFYVLNKLFAFT